MTRQCTIADDVIRNSTERGVNLHRLVAECRRRSPVCVAAPYGTEDQLDAAALRLARWDFSRDAFVLPFHLSESENPFLRLRGEPGRTVTLAIQANSVFVRLLDEEGRELGRAHDLLDPAWTLDDVADSFEMALATPRLLTPIREYLARWGLLGRTAPELAATVDRVGHVFGQGRELRLEDARPWGAWLTWLESAPRFQPLANALAELRVEPLSVGGAKVLGLIADQAPQDLRLVVETSLVLTRQPGSWRAGTDSHPCTGRAGRLLESFAAPGEVLPLPLERRVRELRSGLANLAHPMHRRQSSVQALRPRVPFRLDEWLAKLASKYRWTGAERDYLREALLDVELDHRGSTIRRLRELVEHHDARPGHLVEVLRLRRWCRFEGYGTLRDFESDHASCTPPSYATVYSFIALFRSPYEPEDVSRKLESLCEAGVIDRYDLDRSLFRFVSCCRHKL